MADLSIADCLAFGEKEQRHNKDNDRDTQNSEYGLAHALASDRSGGD